MEAAPRKGQKTYSGRGEGTMSGYKIGKDVGELFARVSALETTRKGCSCGGWQSNSAQNTGGETSDALAGNFIFKTNVLLLLRTGRTAELVEFLEDSLEEELEAIGNLPESNVRTVAFYNAGLVNEKSETQVFSKDALVSEIAIAIKGIAKAQSTTCHPTKNCTGGWNCFRMPWSLKAVDVNKSGIWHYIKGSNCGFTLSGNGCGEPVTGSVCLD
jgi:hypothetical protein